MFVSAMMFKSFTFLKKPACRTMFVSIHCVLGTQLRFKKFSVMLQILNLCLVFKVFILSINGLAFIPSSWCVLFSNTTLNLLDMAKHLHTWWMVCLLAIFVIQYSKNKFVTTWQNYWVSFRHCLKCCPRGNLSNALNYLHSCNIRVTSIYGNPSSKTHFR